MEAIEEHDKAIPVVDDQKEHRVEARMTPLVLP